MSYSIRGAGASIAIAMAALSAAMDDVVAGQPVHAQDRAQALDAAQAFADIVGEPNSAQNINIGLTGSLSWVGSGDATVTGANVAVSVSFTVNP